MVTTIILITLIISVYAWQDRTIFQKLLLSPYILVRNKEYHRLLTHGFLHGNWLHLIVNMLVFWSFGRVLLIYFNLIWSNGNLVFLFFYLSAIVLSSLYSVVKHKDNYEYSAVGASGATSAIVFAYIFFEPWNLVYFFGVLPVPGIIFGIFYLIYSYKMSQKQIDNIGHDAHFWGAVYGFCFPIIFKPQLIQHFIHSLSSFNF